MIVNTAAYLFVPLADAEALTATLHERAKALELRGTILIAEEGINLFLAGSSEGIARGGTGIDPDHLVAVLQQVLGHADLDHSWPYLDVDQMVIRRAFEMAL